MKTLHIVPNTTPLLIDDPTPEGASQDATTAHLLGSGEIEVVKTNRSWIPKTQTAYMVQRDAERASRKLRILTLENGLNDILGIDVGDRNLNQPLVEQPTVDGPIFVLCVAVKCSFCDRNTWRPFSTRTELGEQLADPKGSCVACQRPLAASATSAS